MAVDDGLAEQYRVVFDLGQSIAREDLSHRQAVEAMLGAFTALTVNLPWGYPGSQNTDMLKDLKILGIELDDRTPNDPTDAFFISCFNTSVERVVWRTPVEDEIYPPLGTSGVIKSLIAGAEVQGASRLKMAKAVRRILHTNIVAEDRIGMESYSTYLDQVMRAGRFDGSVLRSTLVGIKDSVVRYHTQSA